MPRSHSSMPVGAAVPSLVAWGRSPDADLVYRAMATFGPRTAGDLARELGMARHRVGDALAELASINAVVPRPGSQSRMTIWVPRRPEELVALLRQPRSVRVGDVARSTMVPFPLGEPGMLPEVARHLKTRALARLRMAELTGIARHETLTINTERTFDATSARAGALTDRKLLNRGVSMRALGLVSPDPDPLWRYGRDPTERRPDYRTVPEAPMKLIVIDRKVALLPVAQDDFARGYLEVVHPPLIAALVALFERHWESARDPLEYAVPDFALNPRERAVVTLLAAGHTDATAARELRISQRSVTNVLRGLMDRLGVDNRFQLGLALGALRVAAPQKTPEPSPEANPVTLEKPADKEQE
jgi:DNA-binding CsgD family transcriptional regulator